LASHFPRPVIFDGEHGVPSGISIPGISISDYDDAHAGIRALGGEHNYRTLILDSIDAFEPMVWATTCQALGVKSIETPGYGKGYVEADGYWRRLLDGFDWLRSRGMIIVLIAHSAAELVNDPRAASYTSYQLRVYRRARGIIQDWADAIGFLATDVVVHSEEVGFNKTRSRGDGGNARWLHWEARPAFVAKNRYGLPAKMMCPADFDFSKQLPPFFSACRGAGRICFVRGNHKR
jgi:hypothetical protein